VEQLVAKAKEYVELLPTLPSDIQGHFADHFRQLAALATIRPPDTLPAVEDRRKWNAKIQQQPTFRSSRPARRPSAATITSDDLRSGGDTVASLRDWDVSRERGAADHHDHVYL
jgi:hypothetical protein